MRGLLLIILCVTVFFTPAYSQVYGNEWINYSQTYFKFQIITDGLYRLSYDQLLLSGIPVSAINGSNYQIFNKGQEIPLYASADVPLAINDYLEFYAVHNDGGWDSVLYADKSWQANDHLSMFNDTSAYYLTWSDQPSSNHFTEVVNDIVNHPAKEPYCWYTSGYVFGQARSTDNFSRGQEALFGYSFFDSDFSNTEGYSDIYFNKSTKSYSVYTPYPYSGGGVANLKTWVIGWGLNDHFLNITVNGTEIFDTVDYGFIVRHLNLDFSSYPVLTHPASTVIYSTEASTSASDRNSVSWLDLKYPREFNFDNSSQVHFSLNAAGTNQYIEIYNFSENETTPVLYDFTNKIRLEAVVENDTEKFVLPPSSLERKLVLLAYDTLSVIKKVDALQPVFFTDFSNPLNQGNFIIISHPFFFQDSTGYNYVEDYKSFKNANGFKSVVIDINQLYDQFAFGIETHPASIRLFTDFVMDKWPAEQRHMLLMGKGAEYAVMWANPAYRSICYVPTFGYPGSDVLLTAAGASPVPRIPIGRLAALSPTDVGNYLNKAQAFVSAQNDPFQTISNKAWMKNIMHLAGGANEFDQNTFQFYLNKYRMIIEDTLYGGKVQTFFKTSTDPIEYIVSNYLDSVISSGVSLITFYGHSSYNSFDFNLDRPEEYNNYGKYPLILTNGCLIGNLFTNYPGMSDQFVFAQDRGAIAFLAPSQFSVSSSLDLYSTNFYKNIAAIHYDESMGVSIAATIQDIVMQSNATIDKTVAEQMLLNGDPSLKMNTHTKPDYALEAQEVSFDPPSVTAGLDSFFLQVIIYNLGKAVDDSFYIDVKRNLPNGTEQFLYHQRIKAPYFNDTVRLSIKTEPTFTFGLNNFNIKIDASDSTSASGEIDEISELNNELTTNLLITSDDILPIFPYEYSIVSEQGVVLKASTVNAFADAKQYVLQIDTTEVFNSALLQEKKILQSGGVVNWSPALTLNDSVVYYWRTSVDTLYGNSFTWHTSSFIYLPGSSPGWNQSHYFQFQSTVEANNNIDLPATRLFSFVDDVKTVGVYNGITTFIGGPLPMDAPGYFINGVRIARLWDCMGYGVTMLFEVIDSLTGLQWTNPNLGGIFGLYNSIQCKSTPRDYFLYNTNTSNNEDVGNFLDTVPDGNYILMMSVNDAYIRNWDSTMLGYFNELGLTQINSITDIVPYVAFLKKNDPDYPVYEVVGDTFTSIIDTNFSITGNWDRGFIESPLIGPAASWNSLQWHTHSLEAGSDSISLQLIGVNESGVETVLSSNVLSQDTSLTGLSVTEFPFLKLRLNTIDTLYRTPVQLDYWRINYQPVPEAALNPSLHFSFDDSVNQFLPLSISIALENVTPWNMDSMLVKYQVTDATNTVHSYSKKYQPLAGGDTIHLTYNFETGSDVYTGGINYLYVEANPDDDQPEQHHFNNLGIISYYIISDDVNPLLDVTFDGIHIMDGDLVSAKPDIHMVLKDESKFLPLNDTSLFDIYLIYPDGSKQVVIFDNVTAFFYAADSGNLGKENSASVTLKKVFSIDGTYQLVVQGFDRSGNASGDNYYKISFEVINKPMISNILNYPNPFSTSTRFVFTLTGSEVPQLMKIQIMTITGKIVKEVFMNDLGNIHIGNNITGYSWDGTDQFGDKLANGLYFYRVTALLNGNDMDHYGTSSDQYFKKGIGKMYLMR